MFHVRRQYRMYSTWGYFYTCLFLSLEMCK
jgi:hypothetical protein